LTCVALCILAAYHWGMAAWTTTQRNAVIALLGAALIVLAGLTMFGDVVALILAGISNLHIEFRHG